MKKVIAVLSLLTVLASLAFADIHPRYRNLEIGVDGSLSAAQNLFTIDDILTETININFTDMAKDLGRKDFSTSINSNANVYLDLKIAFLTFGIYVNLFDVTSGVSLSKDFFNLLGNGNKLDEKMSFYVSSRFEAFSDIYVPVGINLGKLKFTVAPSLFIPLLYMPNTKAQLDVTTGSDGHLNVSGSTNASIYTVFGMGMTEDKRPDLDPEKILSDFGSYFGFAGFDIMGSAEFELFDNLDVGAYIHLPLVPGRLDHSIEAAISYDLDIPSVGDLLIPPADSSDPEDPEGETPSGDSGADNGMFGAPKIETSVLNNRSFKVNRPFRLGAEASFRPFGKWFAIRPSLGIAARNPFGKDFKFGDNVYTEYALNLDMRLLYVICLNFTTAYQDQIFCQEAGVGFNFKVLEVTANVASSGTSFAKSFGLGGVKAKINVKLGF